MKHYLINNDKFFKTLIYIVLIIISISILYPLYYVVIASVTEPSIVGSGKILLYPEKLYLEGYKQALSYSPLWRGYANTVIQTVVGTLIALVLTIPAGYALSRVDLPGRRGLMFLFTFTMFFNGGLIPLYLTVRQLGIYDTIWGVILPVALSAYNLIVCRSFFESGIPIELLEAARIDGCSNFGFFFKIAIPLSKTIIAVLCLFYATGLWNQFFYPLMFLGSEDKMPLQVVLRNLILLNQASSMTTDIQVAMERQKLAQQLKYCVVVASAAPLMMVYPFLQKYFAKGVTIGAVKG